jgi:hypothetical protein
VGLYGGHDQKYTPSQRYLPQYNLTFSHVQTVNLYVCWGISVLTQQDLTAISTNSIIDYVLIGCHREVNITSMILLHIFCAVGRQKGSGRTLRPGIATISIYGRNLG